ncbi:MAG: ABC transporter permease [Acidimicrobiales bacterium]|nr:ABC transporter permease [Acidimicrobiales bacterium]MCB9392266.1 ABC transporter permease [Acidimicrobiaceae bacterium]
MNLDRLRRWPATAVLAGVIVLLYAPLLFLVVASVNRNPASTGWDGFTFDWYRAAWNDESLRDAVAVSVQLAVGAAVLSVVTGTAAAVAARRSRAMQRLNLLFATARVGTPEIILATGLAALLPTIGVDFGRVPMLIAHTAYLSAYVTLIVGARAAGSSATMEESALDLGARPWRVIVDVILPDLRPAIASAGLLALAFSFDDVALSLALRGPDDTTVPIYIFSAVQRRVTPSIHAIGAVIIAIGVVVFAGAALVNRAITDQARP